MLGEKEKKEIPLYIMNDEAGVLGLP